MAYLRTEGVAQTLAKIRTRVVLDAIADSRGFCSVVGVVVCGIDGWPPGTAVLCWTWLGPCDAEYHLVSPEQCVRIPAPERHYAPAPLLAAIGEIAGSIDGGVREITLRGIDPQLAAPLHELVDRRPTGVPLVVGFAPLDQATQPPGAVVVELSAARAVEPLVVAASSSHVSRLPDPGHYFLDPYAPVPLEWPWPYKRESVERAVDLLTRHDRASSIGRPARDVGVPLVAGPRVGPPPPRTLRLGDGRPTPPGHGVSCLGAGNYTRSVLLHHLRRYRPVAVRGVMDIRPEVAAIQGRALGAAFCTTDPMAIMDDEHTDLVLVASDHESHADYAISALRAGKAVHLEKPPAVTPEQLSRLLTCLRATPRARLHLGYNRPYAPAIRELQQRLDALSGPTSVVCRVRGYRLGRAHWYRWPNQGTRIAGNVVHWIDLGYRLCGRQVPVAVEVHGAAANDGPGDPDALTVVMAFADGSATTIHFSSDEDPTYGMREQIEVTRQSLTANIDDFLSLVIVHSAERVRRLYPRDKGHAGNMAALAKLTGDRARIDGLIRDLELTGAVQFAAERALLAGGGRVSIGVGSA